MIEYKIINKNTIECIVFSSSKLTYACHEYLSVINNELDILCKYNIKVPINKLKFDNIYIIETENIPNKKYAYIRNIIRFDINTVTLTFDQSKEDVAISRNENIVPDNKWHIIKLLDMIKHKKNKIISQSKMRRSSRHLIKTKLINNTKNMNKIKKIYKTNKQDK